MSIRRSKVGFALVVVGVLSVVLGVVLVFVGPIIIDGQVVKVSSRVLTWTFS